MWIKRNRYIVSFLVGGLMILLTAPVAFSQTTRISIASCGTGGGYYVYAGGLADLINKHVPGVKATAEVTGCSVANVRLVAQKEAAIGFLMGDVAWESFNGAGRFKGEKIDSIRAIFAMYPDWWTWITTQDTNIKSVSDMVGKKVSSGSPGSGVEYMFNNLISALGYKPKDFKISRLSFADQVNALKDKVIDVGSWSTAMGTSSIIDLATTHPIRIIPLSEEEIKKITGKYSFYFRGKIPAGAYPGVEKAVPTIYTPNIAVVHKDLSEELVYEIVKAIFENIEELQKVHPCAVDTTLENAPNVPVPLHPGAEKYFREKGVL